MHGIPSPRFLSNQDFVVTDLEKNHCQNSENTLTYTPDSLPNVGGSRE